MWSSPQKILSINKSTTCSSSSRENQAISEKTLFFLASENSRFKVKAVYLSIHSPRYLACISQSARARNANENIHVDGRLARRFLLEPSAKRLAPVFPDPEKIARKISRQLFFKEGNRKTTLQNLDGGRKGGNNEWKDGWRE